MHLVMYTIYAQPLFHHFKRWFIVAKGYNKNIAAAPHGNILQFVNFCVKPYRVLLQSFNHCPQGRGRVEVGGNDVRRREFNVKSVADFGDDFHYVEGVENAVVDEFRFVFEVNIGSDFAEYFK